MVRKKERNKRIYQLYYDPKNWQNGERLSMRQIGLMQNPPITQQMVAKILKREERNQATA